MNRSVLHNSMYVLLRYVLEVHAHHVRNHAGELGPSEQLSATLVGIYRQHAMQTVVKYRTRLYPDISTQKSDMKVEWVRMLMSWPRIPLRNQRINTPFEEGVGEGIARASGAAGRVRWTRKESSRGQSRLVGSKATPSHPVFGVGKTRRIRTQSI